MIAKTVRDIDLPITSHLIALRGDTIKSDIFTLYEDDGTTPIDLTGSTITCKGALSDGTLVDLSSYITVDLLAGEFYVQISPTVSNGATPWPEGFGTQDITIEDTSGVVTTYFSGKLGLKEGEHV